MKRLVLLFSAWIVWASADAQLTLEECRRLAGENYPQVRKYGLIEKARAYELSNLEKNYWPQLQMSGKATYQSDATKLPIDLPGVEFEGLLRDQYQVALEVQQVLWDGGVVASGRREVKAASDVEMEQQRVSMYALNERVDALFFGILMLDSRLELNRLLQDELERTHRRVSAYMANGVANQSDLDAVSVERLNAGQQQVELETSRKAYVDMLAAFIGKELPSETTVLQRPLPEEVTALHPNNRPELGLFDARNRQLDVQQSSLKTRFMPSFGLFVQGAYGNPGLNMLEDKFSAYYVAGVRMSWNFGGLYTLKTDQRKIANSRLQVETDRDVFLFNTRLDAVRQDAEVISMKRQMETDDEIIRLRENIRRSAEAKVENGTLTVTDLLDEITAENQARQTKSLHEVQLLMYVWQLKQTLNQ